VGEGRREGEKDVHGAKPGRWVGAQKLRYAYSHASWGRVKGSRGSLPNIVVSNDYRVPSVKVRAGPDLQQAK